MRAKVAIVGSARACLLGALVLLACSDDSGEDGDSSDGDRGGAAGSASGRGGRAGSAGVGNAGRSGGGGAGAGGGSGGTNNTSGQGGASGRSGSGGDAGSSMGGEGGSDEGGEGGEAAVGGGGANMGGGAGVVGGAGIAGNAGGGMSGNGGGGAGAGAAGSGGAIGGAGASGGGAGAGGAGAGAGGAGAGGAGTGGAGGTTMLTFETRVLATDHVGEGADAGDIDGDGVIDLVAGPRWYKGPTYSLGGAVMPNPPTFTRDQYSTFFLTFVDDMNADGRPDVIAIGDAGGGNGTGTPNAFWYANPGPGNFGQAWTKTAIYSGLVSNESPAYVNLLGSARKELVFMTNQTAGYATPGAGPTAAWTYTAVTPSTFGTPYVHGLGVGDIDGDGLNDLVERTGWWRQTNGATWERHAFEFWTGSTTGRPSNWGGAQMPVFDVDGDGDADVVSALAAHRYGITWFERTGTGASISFTAHQILPTAAGAMNNFSQAHAMVAADVNGDGLTDIIAGKRYYAHPSTNPDPGTTDPPVLYWFELRRSGGTATFTPRLIHADSGAGCNFVARDLTGDGKIDIFTTNKRGTFLHVQR